MTIKIISEEETWQQFMIANCFDTFLQSWEWGEFQQAMGQKTWRLGIFNNSGLVACALVIKVCARRGSFLLIPHGPIIKFDTEKLVSRDAADARLKNTLGILKIYLTVLGGEEGCSFVRIAPIMPRLPTFAALFHDLGFVRSPIHVHSEQSWIVDIRPTEQELLTNMRKSTRYIINHSRPGEIIVKQETTKTGFEKFFTLYEQTVLKRGYSGYNKTYLYGEFSELLKTTSVRVYFAYHNNILISTAFVVLYGHSGFYHHGASIIDSKVPASHLLHWHIIKDLKRGGFWFYNFWGVAPDNKPNHPWRGLSVFKKGFGGEEKQYLQTQDFVLTPYYWLNWVVETGRRIKRGY